MSLASIGSLLSSLFHCPSLACLQIGGPKRKKTFSYVADIRCSLYRQQYTMIIVNFCWHVSFPPFSWGIRRSVDLENGILLLPSLFWGTGNGWSKSIVLLALGASLVYIYIYISVDSVVTPEGVSSRQVFAKWRTWDRSYWPKKRNMFKSQVNPILLWPINKWYTYIEIS